MEAKGVRLAISHRMARRGPNGGETPVGDLRRAFLGEPATPPSQQQHVLRRLWGYGSTRRRRVPLRDAARTPDDRGGGGVPN